ncbi:MAG: hypothetical protein K5695_06365 [Oscillospiraceae bacterium]|nr:hypothetical protein [Oscillospiraceae bacterium]
MSEIIVSADYTRAVALTRSIIANAQAAQQSLYEVCKGLKEMRDGKLYKELGYQNFADFCENETGIKISQAKKYVAIADRMTDETASQLAKISTEKLYMLAMLDEPTREAVTETVDVESVTVKELREQISRIESENADLGQKLDAAKESIDSKTKQFHAALASKDAEIEEVRSGWKRRSDTLLEKIRMLNEQIKELEDRPIEHDVVDHTEELEALRDELDATNAALADAQKQLAERPMVQDALPVTDTTDAFKAYLSAAADSMRRLLEFVAKRPNDVNHALYLSRIDGVLNLSNTELAKLKGES